MSIASKRVETFKGRLWHQIFSINTCTSGTFRHQIFSDRFFMSEAVSYKCTAYDLYKIKPASPFIINFFFFFFQGEMILKTNHSILSG